MPTRSLTMDPVRPVVLQRVWLLASITFSFMAGAVAPTPLYSKYQAAWGFSSTILGSVFAAYILLLMVSLLVLGRLSDHVGRKPVIIAAAALQATAMAIFAAAEGTGALFAARLLQGLASGLALTAIGAALLDLDRESGAVANALAPPLGGAAGGLLSGLMVHFLPYPTVSVYAVLGAVYVAQAISVCMIEETAPRQPGALRSLVPVMSIGAGGWIALRRSVPILVAVWAIAGFYSSLAPALAAQVFTVDASLAGGFAVFLFSAVGGLTVYALRQQSPGDLVRAGSTLLILSMAGLIGSISLRSQAIFWCATVLCGIAFGAGFQGGLRAALVGAGKAERTSSLSMAFLVSYASMGAPTVIAGWAVQHLGDLPRTSQVFSAVILLLAAVAFVLAEQARGRQPGDSASPR